MLTYLLVLKKAIVEAEMGGRGRSAESTADYVSAIVAKETKVKARALAASKPAAAAKSSRAEGTRPKSMPATSGTVKARAAALNTKRAPRSSVSACNSSGADKTESARALAGLKRPQCPPPTPSPSQAQNTDDVSSDSDDPDGDSVTSKSNEKDDDEQRIQQARVIRRGWLYKRGQRRTKLKNRLFVLTPFRLSWFKSEMDAKDSGANPPQGFLRIKDLVHMQTSMDTSAPTTQRFEIQLVMKDRTTRLFGSSSQEVSTWLEAMKTAVLENTETNAFVELGRLESKFVVTADTSAQSQDEPLGPMQTSSSPGKRISVESEDSSQPLSSSNYEVDGISFEDSPFAEEIRRTAADISKLFQIMTFSADHLKRSSIAWGMMVAKSRGLLAPWRKIGKGAQLQESLLTHAKKHEDHVAKQRLAAIKVWEACEGGHPCGYLKKPDFKKSDTLTWEQRRGDCKYRRRWFKLADGVLEYFKTKPAPETASKKRTSLATTLFGGGNQKKGELQIGGGAVKEVRSSMAPKAPPFSLDIVTNTHVYTLVAANREEQIAWATVLTRAAGIQGSGPAASSFELNCGFAKLPDSMQLMNCR